MFVVFSFQRFLCRWFYLGYGSLTEIMNRGAPEVFLNQWKLSSCHMTLTVSVHLKSQQNKSVWLQIDESLVQILPRPNPIVNIWLQDGISEAPLDQGVNWYPQRAVSVQVKYSLAPFVGCIQTGSEIVSPRRPKH